MNRSQALSGKITDRIRRGQIPAEALTKKRIRTDEAPSSNAILHASGTGLGAGSTGRRSGPGAQSHDDDE